MPEPSTTMLAIQRLTDIMATLRSPGGCPWDAKQTPATLKPYILEEAYEVLEAIDKGCPEVIEEELGDLLLQIVFQARIHEECGAFDLAGVANTIADKLIRRHPHVFGRSTVTDPEQLHAQWDAIKEQEKKGSTRPPGAAIDSHRYLPALLRAYKIAEKNSRRGVAGLGMAELLRQASIDLQKLAERTPPVEQTEPPTSLAQDFGALLFSLVDLGRQLGINAEDALRQFIDLHVAKSNETNP